MRARVDCPGYRDPLDWSFRDQSEDVIRKSQRPARKKRTVASTSSRTSSSGAQNIIPPPRNSLVYPERELAKAHLFVNYMSGGPSGGHMSYLLPLLAKDPRNCVNAALSAVGLAALSNIRLSPRMLLKARQEYTTALSETNQALQDPILSKRDDTLAAVVLLGMFEVSQVNHSRLSFPY